MQSTHGRFGLRQWAQLAARSLGTWAYLSGTLATAVSTAARGQPATGLAHFVTILKYWI